MSRKYRCDNRKHKKQKPIYTYICYNKEGVTVTVEDTLDEMAKYMGLCESAVSKAVKENRKCKRQYSICRVPYEEVEYDE